MTSELDLGSIPEDIEKNTRLYPKKALLLPLDKIPQRIDQLKRKEKKRKGEWNELYMLIGRKILNAPPKKLKANDWSTNITCAIYYLQGFIEFHHHTPINPIKL